ncbi:MAG: YqgE/AlgH family protein [Nitrospinota bacterium]
MSLSRLIGASLAAGAVFFPSGGPPNAVVRPDTNHHREQRNWTFHAGELLVAAPRMRDPRFRKAVILLVRHDRSGAFGLVVNRVLRTVKVALLLERLGLKTPDDAGEIVVHYGGPVEPQRGFVLHSTELQLPNAHKVNDDIALSSHVAVLRAIALGKGPRRTIFAVGYAGWGPGQLEGEMRRGDWFTAPADIDILFDVKQDTKWTRAMARRFRTL